MREGSAVARRGKHRERPRGPWRFPWGALVIALLVTAGVATMLYPRIANWMYEYNQAGILENFQQQVDHADPSAAEQIEMAHRYNESLTFGASVEANHRIPTGSGHSNDAGLDYNQILRADESGMIGRIRIDKIDVDLPIYHGTSDGVLLKGVGHLEGSSLPVGGVGTHAVLTGHRGLANAELFTRLDEVDVGDRFTLEVMGEVLTYEVKDTRVVEPTDTEALRIDRERDLVTLITCTPLGINTHRILVTGERVLPTPQSDIDDAGKRPELPRFPWWAVGLAALVVADGVFVWRCGYPPKPRKRKQAGREQREP